MAKKRIDVVLTESHGITSRESAQRLIRAGKILVDETVIDKPGALVGDECVVRVKKPETEYASRGGEKLSQAVKQFELDLRGIVAADLGASNGGFTDCLLKHGAKRVYAIDVGKGQLAYSLQTDERVVVMDGVNCRYLKLEDLREPVDWVVGDLSFISLKTVFPAVKRISKDEGQAVLLIKPQFEIGKDRVGKKGLVKNPNDHIDVLQEMHAFFTEQGWFVLDLCHSPITGKTGNIEYLIWLGKKEIKRCLPVGMVPNIVQHAHQSFKTKYQITPP